jgi:methyl-accepting chemotaxis protein
MFSSLRILPRLLLGLGSVLLLLAAVAGFSVRSGWITQGAFDDVSRLRQNDAAVQRVEKRVYEGRLHVWMALGTGEPVQWDKADAAFKNAHDRLHVLIGQTTDPTRLAAAHDIDATVTAFEGKAAELRRISLSTAPLATAEGQKVAHEAMALGSRIDEIGERLSIAFGKAADEQAKLGTRQIEETIAFSTWLGCGSIVMGLLIAFTIARGISKPIQAITNSMSVLARGTLDIAIPGAERRDEVGAMAASVAIFRDGMVEAARLRAEQEQASRDAARNRREAMLALADRFDASVGEIVNAVGTQANELQSTAQSMGATAEETARQSMTVAAASEQATQNVATVASAAEELATSIREITMQVTESNRTITEAVERANRGVEEVHNLSQAGEKIGDVVRIISDIASQTNLLALNATIEAARAGEAGKGFAVVASEVKALANQTAKATEEIETQIRAMRDATQASVDSISGINKSIARVSESATAISAAMEEQGAATQEIARNVQEASRGTADVSSNIGGVQTASRDTSAAASQVLASANALGQNGRTLKQQVDRFLEEVRAA